MKKILWLSPVVPYDKVNHAGGKTQNFYIKSIAREEDLDVRLLSFYKSDEKDKMDAEKYGIKQDVYLRGRGSFFAELKRGISWVSKSFLFNRYVGLVPIDIQQGTHKLLKDVVAEGYIPDIVLLHWTEMLFFLPEIKNIWPNAKYVAVEEDVSFLGLRRRKEFFHNFLIKKFFQVKEKKVRIKEIDYLNQCSLAIFTNKKDYDLAVENGFNGQGTVWSPFYQDFSSYEFDITNNKDVYFYGAMNREENWRSAEWFIKNVMPLINDKSVRFVIVGGGAGNNIKKYASDNVIIKGYVDSVEEELSKGLCLVSPLVLGAGIKVKVLESMSLGIPVLTNDIGIEGIPAEDGISYFHCTTPEEYAKRIEELANNKDKIRQIGIEGRKVIKQEFDYKQDALRIANMLRSL